MILSLTEWCSPSLAGFIHHFILQWLSVKEFQTSHWDGLEGKETPDLYMVTLCSHSFCPCLAHQHVTKVFIFWAQLLRFLPMCSSVAAAGTF